MIDLHCHLLPAVDDGAPEIDTALAMAQAQVDAGVRTVAATPHANGRFRTDAALVARAVAELRTALRAAGIALELLPGAEIDLPHALDADDEELLGLALGATNLLLLEAPLTAVAPLEAGIAQLHARGFRVLLAHPERAPMLQRDPAAVTRLIDAGVRTQLTAGSLDGRFGRTVQRFAQRLLDEGLVHTFASDAHNARERPPGLRAPLEAAGLANAVRQLCEEHPAALLAGAHVPPIVKLAERRRGRFGLSNLRR